MEQRINALEEEFKVLKSQIKAVLLDIKDSLATGNAYSYSPRGEGSVKVGAGPLDTSSGLEPTAVGSYSVPGHSPADGYSEPVHVLGHETESELSHGDSAEAISEQIDSVLQHRQGQKPAEVNTGAVSNLEDRHVVDLLTVSVIAQWLSRAITAVGKGRIGKLVEIYDVTGNLPSRLKETMLLLAEIYGGSQPEDTAPTTDDVPASVSIQLLIELDSLLRYRGGALESVVVSMLLDRDKGMGNGKKAGYG